MKRLLILAPILGIVACEDGSPYNPQGTTATCSDETLEPASGGELQITRFIFNGGTFFPQFFPTGSYDDEPGGCFTSGRGKWILEVGAVDWGTIELDSEFTGNLDIATSSLSISIYGEGTPTTFTGADFQSGSLQVNSLDPLQVDIVGYAINSDGYTLDISTYLELY